MNYYVWVMARGADGFTSQAAMANTFDFFTGTWVPFNEAGDQHQISNNCALVYGMPGYEFEGFVRGIIPCGERSISGEAPPLRRPDAGKLGPLAVCCALR